MTDSESCSEDLELQRENRGTQQGVKRGKYRKWNQEKKLIVTAAESIDGDWQSVAKTQGVPLGTAYTWIKNSDKGIPRKHGGARKGKVTDAHVEKMVQYIENNPLITLAEIKKKLHESDGVAVSTTTIHNYLDCQFYTVKKTKLEPSAMNSMPNKQKRSDYVSKAMQLVGNSKTLIYIDESNCNLFSRRNFGRSKKGNRCSVKLPTSKGKNVHIIAGISQTGLIHWERRRGHFKKEDCRQWMRNLMDKVHEPFSNVVIVCDNAPIHADLETLLDEEFHGAELLRLAPYSAPLNPIEECWSVVKSEIKKLLNVTLQDVLQPAPQGMTQTEYRLKHLETIIDESMPKISPTLCMKTCNHVQRHYPSVLSLKDLQMGDIPHSQ